MPPPLAAAPAAGYQVQNSQAAFSAALAQAAAGPAAPPPAAMLQLQQQAALMAAALAEAQRQGFVMPSALPPSLPIAGMSWQGQQQGAAAAAAAAAAPSDAAYTAPRSARAERARSRSMGGSSGAARGSLSPSGAGAAPPPAGAAPRTARKSVSGAGEMAECTFHPRITPLPAQYTARREAGGRPFAERVQEWERSKREEAVRAAADRSAAELAECTFAPTINATSKEVVRARGYGATEGVQIYERLYRQGKRPGTASAGPRGSMGGGGGASGAGGGVNFSVNADGTVSMLMGGGGGGGDGGSPNRGRASTRLSLLASGRPLFTSGETGSPHAPLDRARLAEAAEGWASAAGGGRGSGEDSAAMGECTFAPKVNPVLDARPVRSRYRDPTPTRSASRPRPLPSGMEQCTFQPKTNPVRAGAMPAAAVYVQAPIYDRLARTQTASQREREKQVSEDLARLAASEEGGEEGGGGANQAGTRSSSAEREAALTPEEREERARKLSDFLGRQEAALRKKAADVEAMKAATAPVLQPALCEKSLRIVEEKALGPFLDRVTRDKIVKEQEVSARVGRAGGMWRGMPSPGAANSTQLTHTPPPPPPPSLLRAVPPHDGHA
jgi:hypothetical protein